MEQKLRKQYEAQAAMLWELLSSQSSQDIIEELIDYFDEDEVITTFPDEYQSWKENQEDNEEAEDCWTCGEKGSKREYRDALGEFEITCLKCHRNEYPEQYEEEEKEEARLFIAYWVSTHYPVWKLKKEIRENPDIYPEGYFEEVYKSGEPLYSPSF